MIPCNFLRFLMIFYDTYELNDYTIATVLPDSTSSR